MQAPRTSSARSFPDQIWQDSLVEPEEVRLQQNSDASFKQLGNGSFGKVSRLSYSMSAPAAEAMLSKAKEHAASLP